MMHMLFETCVGVPNSWNILTDEGVIPGTSRINWIDHFLMNIFYIQG